MIFRFFHDKIKGDEWYIVKQLNNGSYVSICTRPTNVYKLGAVRTFFLMIVLYGQKENIGLNLKIIH